MYLKSKQIAEKYSLSRSTLRRMLQEMTDSKRYPASAIVGDTCRRIDAAAFQDFMENRAMLRHPNMRRYLKPYKEGKS